MKLLHRALQLALCAVLSIATVLAAGCAGTPPARTSAAPADQPALRTVQANGIRMRIAEMGSGPLVVLLHGWPESWYSWRHQLPALAGAGYRVVAPDLRGYGRTDVPPAVEDYDIHKLTADVTGLLDALGERDAVLVGHDWGAVIGWHAVQVHPERFRALVALSSPWRGRAAESPVATMQKTFGDNFFFQLYFQEPGVAEQEFDADPRGLLSRLYVSPGAARAAPRITEPKRAAGGMIARLGVPNENPAWLTPADLDYYVTEFRHTGFRGSLSYFRNMHRNWETTRHLASAQVTQPVLFLAGDKDPTLRGATAQQLAAAMAKVTKDLRGVKLYPGAGHWIQQERPADVNAALGEFLRSLPK